MDIPLTPEQASRFLQVLNGNRLEGFFRVAVDLGMHQAEILGLRWEDIDLESKVLSVRRTLQRVKMPGEKKSRLVQTEPKHRSRCDLPIPESVCRSLVRHRATQEGGERHAAWIDTGYVFTSTVGTPLDDCNVTHRFKDLCHAAGVPIIRFHDLRHTIGTFLHLEEHYPSLSRIFWGTRS